jgi:hypothetical protein
MFDTSSVQPRNVTDRYCTAHHCKSPNLDGYWVCVVVVEVAGTAGIVVVVLVVVVGGGGVAQPDSDDAMTTAAKHAMISFFINIIFVWLVTLPARDYAIGCASAMGCNPTMDSSVSMAGHRVHPPSRIAGPRRTGCDVHWIGGNGWPARRPPEVQYVQPGGTRIKSKVKTDRFILVAVAGGTEFLDGFFDRFPGFAGAFLDPAQ